MNYIMTILLGLLLTSCVTSVREVTETETKDINTVTKTTAITETPVGDAIIPLKTTTYSETITQDISNMEQKATTSVPMPNIGAILPDAAKGMLSSFLPPGILDAILLALGLYGSKKTYDVVRDAKPRGVTTDGA